MCFSAIRLAIFYGIASVVVVTDASAECRLTIDGSSTIAGVVSATFDYPSAQAVVLRDASNQSIGSCEVRERRNSCTVIARLHAPNNPANELAENRRIAATGAGNEAKASGYDAANVLQSVTCSVTAVSVAPNLCLTKFETEFRTIHPGQTLPNPEDPNWTTKQATDYPGPNSYDSLNAKYVACKANGAWPTP